MGAKGPEQNNNFEQIVKTEQISDPTEDLKGAKTEFIKTATPEINDIFNKMNEKSNSFYNLDKETINNLTQKIGTNLSPIVYHGIFNSIQTIKLTTQGDTETLSFAKQEMKNMLENGNINNISDFHKQLANALNKIRDFKQNKDTKWSNENVVYHGEKEYNLSEIGKNNNELTGRIEELEQKFGTNDNFSKKIRELNFKVSDIFDEYGDKDLMDKYENIISKIDLSKINSKDDLNNLAQKITNEINNLQFEKNGKQVKISDYIIEGGVGETVEAVYDGAKEAITKIANEIGEMFDLTYEQIMEIFSSLWDMVGNPKETFSKMKGAMGEKFNQIERDLKIIDGISDESGKIALSTKLLVGTGIYLLYNVLGPGKLLKFLKLGKMAKVVEEVGVNIKKTGVDKISKLNNKVKIAGKEIAVFTGNTVKGAIEYTKKLSGNIDPKIFEGSLHILFPQLNNRQLVTLKNAVTGKNHIIDEGIPSDHRVGILDGKEIDSQMVKNKGHVKMSKLGLKRAKIEKDINDLKREIEEFEEKFGEAQSFGNEQFSAINYEIKPGNPKYNEYIKLKNKLEGQKAELYSLDNVENKPVNINKEKIESITIKEIKEGDFVNISKLGNELNINGNKINKSDLIKLEEGKGLVIGDGTLIVTKKGDKVLVEKNNIHYEEYDFLDEVNGESGVKTKESDSFNNDEVSNNRRKPSFSNEQIIKSLETNFSADKLASKMDNLSLDKLENLLDYGDNNLITEILLDNDSTFKILVEKSGENSLSLSDKLGDILTKKGIDIKNIILDKIYKKLPDTIDFNKLDDLPIKERLLYDGDGHKLPSNIAIPTYKIIKIFDNPKYKNIPLDNPKKLKELGLSSDDLKILYQNDLIYKIRHQLNN